MPSGRFPPSLEKYTGYIDSLQQKLLSLPEPERAYFLSLAQQTRDLFLGLFEQCLDLSESVADLCMEISFARYELEQTFEEALQRASGGRSHSSETEQRPST
ncbi:hypothetical protein THTE_0956 [Thermogutta terrifontis]|uniref:Uncharacterized protein n=1 Tax=Thermogutta terrifontis TaxID=1331910 RepID=A0A286RC78_9BACT|nr:hypothetical protein [Thermogutta terrifontis]ASV73558.1 hypothetical protein THTE_0956 [Thermogutta terrifontis]